MLNSLSSPTARGDSREDTPVFAVEGRIALNKMLGTPEELTTAKINQNYRPTFNFQSKYLGSNQFSNAINHK
jgi:hypothetical protein